MVLFSGRHRKASSVTRRRLAVVATCAAAGTLVAGAITAVSVATAADNVTTTPAAATTLTATGATLSARTYPTTWRWAGNTIKDFATPTTDQSTVLTVEGLTSRDRNAAALLRYTSATDLLRMKVAGAEVALEDGRGLLRKAARPGPASTSSGTLEVTVVGSELTAKWNGKVALTYTLTTAYNGKQCGMEVWQNVASSVKAGVTCSSLGGAVTPTPEPTSTSPSTPPTTAPTVPPTTTPTQTAAPNPGDTTPGWLSGASGPHAANGTFDTWRGSKVEVGGTWLNDPALYTLTGNGELANWVGPVDVGISPPDWQGWQAEANGVHDAFYRQMFTNLKAARAGKGTVYVRPWYEFNGNWMPYAVAPGQEGVFKQAWIRMAGIARAAFPGVKLVYCASASGGANVFTAFPGAGYVDVGGIDFYNNWPFTTTQAGFDDKITNGAGAYSMEKLRLFYQSQGIPFAVNEWSNQGARRGPGEGGGGESPQFIRSMHDYFAKHAGTGPGQLVYEVLFNLWPDQFQLFPANQTVQPQTAAEYARIF